MLASVVSGYQFVLMDTNVITDPFFESNLGDRLHSIHTSRELRQQQATLENYVRYWDALTHTIIAEPHVYTTPAVLTEIFMLHQHIERCAQFHQSLLATELHCAHNKKYLDAHGRSKRLFNNSIERTRRETQETSLHEIYIERSAAVTTLARMTISIHTLMTHFKRYNGERNYQTALPGKISPTDMTLIDALFTYLVDPQHQNDYGTIITADGDIFKAFLHILNRVERSDLVPSLIERASVSFYDTKNGVIQTKQYNPQYYRKRPQSIRTDMH